MCAQAGFSHWVKEALCSDWRVQVLKPPSDWHRNCWSFLLRECFYFPYLYRINVLGSVTVYRRPITSLWHKSFHFHCREEHPYKTTCLAAILYCACFWVWLEFWKETGPTAHSASQKWIFRGQPDCGDQIIALDFQFSVGCGSKVWGEHANYMQVSPDARTPVLHGPRPNNITAVLSGRKPYNEFEVGLTKCFGLIWNFMASKRIHHLCIQGKGTCSFLKKKKRYSPHPLIFTFHALP